MQSPDLYFDQIILYIMSNIIKSCCIAMEICSFLHYNPSFIVLSLNVGMYVRSDTMKPKLFWIQIWWYQTFLLIRIRLAQLNFLLLHLTLLSLCPVGCLSSSNLNSKLLRFHCVRPNVAPNAHRYFIQFCPLCDNKPKIPFINGVSGCGFKSYKIFQKSNTDFLWYK